MTIARFALWLATVCAACKGDDPEVATGVDLQRFEGKWYEIAHLPRPTQRDCTATVATYTRQADDSFMFAHECTLSSGAYYGKTAIAKVPDLHVPAKLTVDFGGYVGDYWILDVGPDYRYAVVGHPSRDYLWVLSRAPTLAPADHDAALASAKQKGFDVTRLESTPLGPDPSGTPAPPATYGCAASPAFSGPGGALVTMIACVLVVRLRRRSPAHRRATMAG
jgi:apolipoprotein D and lipocalin family protein